MLKTLRSASRPWFVMLAAMSLLLGGCGGGGGGAGSGAGELLVRVADSRQPAAALEGATVTVVAGETNKSATTAADGTALFRDLPAGTATVTVTRDLFQPFTGTAAVKGGSVLGFSALLQRRSGEVHVKALDTFGAPVPNVQPYVDVEGQTITAVTNAAGDAVLTPVPTGSVAVQMLATGFLDIAAQTVTVAESPASSVEFLLERRTEPGGGVVPPPPTQPPPPPPLDGGQGLTFTVRVVVIDGQGQAIENLTAAAFSLAACVDADPDRVECVRSTSVPTFDAAYAPTGTGPAAFSALPGQAPVPFAATMGYDQSGSISDSDPTDARVYATKVFLQRFGPSDRAALAAFAVGSGSKLPTTPVTYFAPFTGDGPSFFDELDQFSALEGGSTPLYQALDALLQYTAQNAPGGIPGQRKAVVLFTDGFDNVCADAAVCRENSIDLSRSLGVDVFTIGLAGAVDSATLAELAYRANGVHFTAANPEQLTAVYGSLPALLRGTIPTYQTTWTIRASTAGVFASGRSVLGKVRVVTGGQTLELPFLYTIP